MTFLDMPRQWPGFLTWNRGEVGALLRLAGPVTGLALVNMAMSVTDTVMVAGFGPEALAAVAVASDAYSIVFYLAIGCIGGLAPLYAAAHAGGDGRALARLLAAGWGVVALLALPTFALIWFGPLLLPVLGIDAGLVASGSGYMRAMALTVLPMLGVAVLRTRLTAIERPGAMLKITLLAVPLNAALNQWFMHGIGLGVTGAGIASLLVASLTLLALLIETRRMGDTGLARPALSDVREIFRIGFPIGVTTLAEVGLYLGATLYAATLSVADAAAHALAIRMAGLTYAAYVGLQQAAMVRVARGAETAQSAMALACVAGVAIMAGLVVLAEPLAGAMLADGAREAARTGAVLLLLLAVADLFGPAGAVAAGLLRGLKVTRPVMSVSLFAHWAVAAPLVLVLTQLLDWGAVGIWIALTTGTVLTTLLTLRVLARRAQA